MSPGQFEQALVPPSYGVPKSNLCSIGTVNTEEKSLKMLKDYGQTDAGDSCILIAHQRACSPGELKTQQIAKTLSNAKG